MNNNNPSNSSSNLNECNKLPTNINNTKNKKLKTSPSAASLHQEPITYSTNNLITNTNNEIPVLTQATSFHFEYPNHIDHSASQHFNNLSQFRHHHQQQQQHHFNLQQQHHHHQPQHTQLHHQVHPQQHHQHQQAPQNSQHIEPQAQLDYRNNFFEDEEDDDDDDDEDDDDEEEDEDDEDEDEEELDTNAQLDSNGKPLKQKRVKTVKQKKGKKQQQQKDSKSNDVDTRKVGDKSSKQALKSRNKKTKGRVKIKMEFIENKIRRYTTFSKRKTGIMKKAYELSTLTGTQVMLLVASETGHVYTFATDKLQPMITSETGKSLIQSCLSYNQDSNEHDANDNNGAMGGSNVDSSSNELAKNRLIFNNDEYQQDLLDDEDEENENYDEEDPDEEYNDYKK